MKTPATEAAVAVPLTVSNRINMFAVHMCQNSGGVGDGSASMYMIDIAIFIL